MSYKKLLYLPLVIVVIFIVLLEVVMETQLNEYARSSAEKRQLADLANMITHLHSLPSLEGQSTFQDKAKELSGITDYRITFIEEDGVVIADSSLGLSAVWDMDNHANRPEVLQTQNRGAGLAWRWSKTLNLDMLYTAGKLSMLDQVMTLRLAKPREDVLSIIKKQRLIFYTVGFIALLITGFVGLMITRRVERLIQQDQQELESQIVERTQAISTLNKIGTLLSACDNYAEIETVLNAMAVQVLPNVSGAVAIYRSSRDKLEVLTSWGKLAPNLKGLYLPDECWGLKKGSFHLCDSDDPDITCVHSMDMNIDAYSLCIPLMAQGEIMGTLHLYSTQQGHLQSNLMLAQSLAENLSVKVANLQLREILRNQAIRDPLTGLYNRRYLQESLDKELNRSQRTGKPLALMMLDADHFKRFNDEHGHDAGDLVLNKIGQMFEKCIRKEDIACRFGGEEFTVVLIDADLEYAAEVADRIRLQVSEIELFHQGRPLPSITLSIGLAISNGSDGIEEPINDLIKRADDALYIAKAAGRNCLQVAASAKR